MINVFVAVENRGRVILGPFEPQTFVAKGMLGLPTVDSRELATLFLDNLPAQIKGRSFGVTLLVCVVLITINLTSHRMGPRVGTPRFTSTRSNHR